MEYFNNQHAFALLRGIDGQHPVEITNVGSATQVFVQPLDGRSRSAVVLR